MTLPLRPPVDPQLALSRKELPEGEEWVYEPKWDGFRVIGFVDGSDVFLQSRNGRPLARYFPELSLPFGRYVFDAEVVVLDGAGREDFDALQNRMHPAESRVRLLAEATPATLKAFDLLAEGRSKLIRRAFEDRRASLGALIEGFDDPGSLEVTPLLRAANEARPLLASGEGVIAKRLDAPYLPGERKGMVKVKRVRTLDCVVVGWRPGKEEGTVGSLILGLYEPGGELRVVGHTSSFRAKEKRELRAKLSAYETGERGSGDPSRWSHDRDLEWVSVRPELVVEVSFDHVSSGRIRHGAKLLRWRDDKDPRDCTFDQLR